jgi:dihydrofolate reductase
MLVRADLNISLDGFAAPAPGSGTPENPFGEDWFRLVGPYTATRTFQERVLGNPDTGTTGVNDRYAIEYFDDIGVEIMGAGKFGLHNFPDDPDWKGWWGDNPPFHTPVFVLTHSAPRPSIEMEGGTTFHFLSATPEEALAKAVAVANGRDIRIGGGPTVVRDFLKAGLIDVLHVAVTPIILGRGERLWDDLRGVDLGYSAVCEGGESGVAHVTFTRLGGAAEPPAEP